MNCIKCYAVGSVRVVHKWGYLGFCDDIFKALLLKEEGWGNT